MKLIAVGDNVTDCYLDEGIYYPGGNAVNVAVDCKRDGAEKVNYIGVFGNDDRADYIRACMEEEGVTCERSRKVFAPTCQPGVKINEEGDRIFVGGIRDTCQHLFSIRLQREDLEVIKEYDICHTSCYSNLEYELETLSRVCKVSFDFADGNLDYYLIAGESMPEVLGNYTYLTGTVPVPQKWTLGYHQCRWSYMSEEEIHALAKKAAGYGTKIIGITRGSKGSVFYDGTEFYTQGICKVDVVDAMGAGDAFIAAFLRHYADNKDMKEALSYAAERAAYACTYAGGFGHPHKA